MGGFERIFLGTKDFMLRVDDLKKKLPALRAKLLRVDDLEPIWNWCFDFCKVRDPAASIVRQQVTSCMLPISAAGRRSEEVHQAGRCAAHHGYAVERPLHAVAVVHAVSSER